MDVKTKALRLKELELDARVYLDECRDITDYVLPQKGQYLNQKPNQKPNRFSKIIDPTASEDLKLLAAGIQGGLSSQSRPWFVLETRDKALMQLESIASWLYAVQQTMYATLAGSNFYPKIHEFYGDQGGFGNAVMTVEQDTASVIRFRVANPGQYFFAEGPNGVIDTLYLKYPMRAANVLKRWPDTASDEVRNFAQPDKKPFAWIDIVHAIEVNYDRDPNKADNLNMLFSSHYWEYAKTERFLSVSGYNDKPFVVGRWESNDTDAYAVGPGQVALGLIKMLQSMQKSSLKAIHKEVDPPLKVPTTLKGALNTLPGGINPVASNSTTDSVSRLYEMNFDYVGIEGKIDRIQQMIHTLFKRDLFLLITDRPEMTATEVVERSQEKLIMLGPVTERQIPDVLEPVLTRTFNILLNGGYLPPAPPELEGRSLKLDFVSLLAQAQKMLGLQGLRSYTDMALTVANGSPESLAKTNFDAILEEYASSLSLPPHITRSDEEAGLIRQQQQQIEQLAQEVEMLKQGSEAAKNLSEIQEGESVE